MHGRTPALRTESCPAPSGCTEPAWGADGAPGSPSSTSGAVRYHGANGGAAGRALCHPSTKPIGRPGLRAAELHCSSVQEEVGAQPGPPHPCRSTTLAHRAAEPGEEAGSHRLQPRIPSSAARIDRSVRGAPEQRSVGGPERIITARSTSLEFAFFSVLPFLTLPMDGRSALPSPQRRCSRHSALQLLHGGWGLSLHPQTHSRGPPGTEQNPRRCRVGAAIPPGADLCSHSVQLYHIH